VGEDCDAGDGHEMAPGATQYYTASGARLEHFPRPLQAVSRPQEFIQSLESLESMSGMWDERYSPDHESWSSLLVL